MIIIKKDKVIEDNYVKISSLEELNINDNLIVDLDFWKDKKKLLLSSKKNLALKLNSDDCINDFCKDLKIFKLLILNFNSFKDGRLYTIANDLRGIFNYKKEIRASGDILPDQYIFLIRCGFDTVEINPEQKNTWFQIYKNDVGLYYQVGRK